MQALFVRKGAEWHSATRLLEERDSQRSSAVVILFKACPRCGGDVNTTHAEDIFCVQCAHRPQVADLGPRAVDQAPGRETGAASCPRCASPDHTSLDKLRRQDNTCYRCRHCGHIFSPATDTGERQRTTS